jgi:hypothetical protein
VDLEVGGSIPPGGTNTELDLQSGRSAVHEIAMRFGLTRFSSLAIFFFLCSPAFAGPSNNPPPEIVARSAWAAKRADTTLMTPQTPRAIVIHHTGEKRAPQLPLQQKLQRLLRFAQAAGVVGTQPKPPWGDVPYHFYVDAAGRIGEGRSLAFAGDSNTHYDTANRIQIVVEGHFNQEEPSVAQLRSLDRLVVWLAARYKVPAASVSGHGDHVANTDCPGQGLKAHLPGLRAMVAKATR